MTVALLVGLALVFGLMNGFNDSGSLVATLVSTGAVGMRRALLIAALANFVGCFLFGVEVARVIGQDIVEPNGITLISVGAALLAALIWHAVAVPLGVPSSSSYALIGGLIGGGIGAGGLQVVELKGIRILVLSFVLAPLAAALGAWLVLRVTLWLASGASPSINGVFRRSQLITAILLSLGHGTSNGQKTMGIIALILFLAGVTPQFEVPRWVMVASATSLSIGIAFGGWQIIRTLGARLLRLRPIHGFVAQLTAGLVMVGATLLGGPVSLNQIAGAAIVGAGSADRLSKVRWEVARQLTFAWVITLPATACVAFLLYHVIELVIG
ncbi:MAG TPA: inorganic phosphate transporter [Chloroflexota bacterium]|nr:inorganic phosphate transporter [Chloroflexota bacterium]